MNLIAWLQSANVQAALIGAAVAGTVTMVGWVTTHYLQERVRRLEARRTFLRRQIEEFYAPLLGLVQTRNWLQDMQDKRVQKYLDEHNNERTPEWAKIFSFFQEEYTFPAMVKIAEFLQQKSFLMEEHPKSFEQAVRHAVESHALFSLWRKAQIEGQLDAHPWPETLEADIRRTKERLEQELRSYLGYKVT